MSDVDFTIDSDVNLHTRSLRLLMRVNRTSRRRLAEPGAYDDAVARYQACLAEVARRRDRRGLGR